ncbi:MAG TPA: thioredoxin-disulfide reductase [Spirochaetota bacterium]|nr:thioredoxin-disulfide reductase [Spirochaetota bacterium]
MEQVVIIGSGPAGHTAAIYTGRAGLKPLLYEGMMAGGIAPGGQLTTTTEIENFPGFPDGIDGMELMNRLRTQSEKYGSRIITKTVDRVALSSEPLVVYTGEEKTETRTIIIATGATARRLNVPGEKKLWNKGISACAVCDGALPIFRNKELYVIGGGDTACEEALHLTKFAAMVYIVHRRDQLRAGKAMQDKVLNHKKIKIIWDTVLQEVKGESKLETVVLKNLKTAEITQPPAAGLFYGIGHIPNTAFINGQLDMDEKGYINTKPGTTRASRPGVFAAGDVQDSYYRQAVTSAGTGCMAALEAEAYLSDKGFI